jgi:nonribosomal peptide synthetase DhbF
MTDALFVDEFARVARAHAGRLALEHGETRLTYAELAEHARALAGALAREGVARGDLVAIALPKSSDTVVAILAVWLLGAAWVPIDPSWPEGRARFIAREASVRAAIGAPIAGVPSISAAARATLRARGERAPTDLAYVMYTSGSTGAPKGVRVSHAGIVPVLRAQSAAFHLTAAKRCLLVLAPTFDACISDIGTALLAGATLVVPEGTAAPSRVRAWLADHRITHVDLPPSLLARIPARTLPPCLQTVVIGGEVAPAAAVRAWAKHVRVVNVYGPTEATICASLCVCDTTWSRPLLGEPIAGARYRVEDGELLIEGPGLALGYVARSELEAARFVKRGAARAYRTGDRVKRHRDGALEFAGRLDRQVKVRGVLVAPEEIEACLAAHPAVARAAVVVRGEELAAFVVPRVKITRSALARHVAARLPRALWPTRLAVVPELPQTPSGKVDLEALARMPLARGRSSTTAAQPRGALERALARLFRAALGIESLGRSDDFFDLGGDSLAVLEVVAAAEAGGMPLSPEAIYLRPTVAALARAPVEEHALSARALARDVEKALTLACAPPERGGGAVLVTGATGFLGARVVRELVREGREVHCLVRGREAPQGTHAHHGDVSQPRFGLGREEWDRLREQVSSVYHLAACVHFALPYARLRATNLLGTAHVLAFARGKRLHYASTLSVGACAEPRRARFAEATPLGEDGRIFGGYAQSKWAAEALVRRAGEREAPRWTIYRLGLLAGDSRTGRGARACQLGAFVRGVARVGALPRTAVANAERLRFDVTPVDWAARALVALSLGEREERVFHLCGPRPASLAELLGVVPHRVEALSAAAFRRRVEASAIDHATATTLLSLCRRALSTDDRHAMRDLFLATEVTFGRTNTARALPDMPCPPPGRALLARYVGDALEAPPGEAA